MPIRSHKIQAHDVDLRPEDIGAPTKEYVENQINMVIETGISKLRIYPLSSIATTEGQKEFTISLDTFDNETDTVLVQSGRTMLFPNQDFTISDDKVVLDEGVPKDRVIGIYVFKNVPMGKDGAVSGKSIAKNSLPLDRTEFAEEFNQLVEAVQDLQQGGGGGTIIYDSPVKSVNGKTGDVELSATDVGALPNTTNIPTKTSDLTNDSGYLTQHQDLSGYAKTSDIPTKMSQLDCDIDLPTKNDLGNTILEDSTSFEEPEIDPVVEARIENVETELKDALIKTANYITPEMYGAKGDGSTDDSVAIQSAIDKAESTDIVYLSGKTYLTTSTLKFTKNSSKFHCDGTIKYTGTDCAICSDGTYQNIYIDYISALNGTGLKVDAKEKKPTQNDYTINRIDAGIYGIYLSVPSDASTSTETAITYCDFRLGHVQVKNPNSDLTKETICFFAECLKSTGYINENNVWATKFSGAKIGAKLYSSPDCKTGGYGVNDTIFHTSSFEGLKGNNGADGCAIELNRTSGNEFKRFRCHYTENNINKTMVFKGYCSTNTIYNTNLVLSEIDYSELADGSRKNMFKCTYFKLPSTRHVNSGTDVELNHLGFCYHANMNTIVKIDNGTLGDDLIISPKCFNGEIPEQIEILKSATELKDKTLIVDEVFYNQHSIARGNPFIIFCRGSESAPKYFADNTGNVIIDNSDGSIVGKYIAIRCLGLARQSDSDILLNKYVWDVVVLGDNPLTLRKSINEKLDASALPTAINSALSQAKASGEFNGKSPVKGTDYFTDADKAEMVTAVINALPVYSGEVL